MISIAIVGFGKIAADEHVPAIAANPRLTLAGSTSRSGHGVDPKFTSHTDLLAAVPDLQSVSITTPPGPRYAIARDCIAAGLHVMLEKPPTATLGQVAELQRLAEAKGTTLFTTWHAQHNPAVTAAAELLKGEQIAELEIVWHEDVHKWHPGQQWIWEAGGFGVFDPGINAFSVATAILPAPLFVQSAELTVPANAQNPIQAEIVFDSPAAASPDASLRCSLDFSKTDGEEWTIRVRTASGKPIELREGGKRLFVGDEEQAAEGAGEYPDLYAKFVDLIDRGESLVDVEPLRLVADTLLAGTRKSTDPITM